MIYTCGYENCVPGHNVDLAKGVFVAGDQVQIIFGAGLVNDVYTVFAENNNMKNMSLSDLKT